MVAPGFLKNPGVIHWLGGAEPAWTLLTFESMNALRQEPSSENRALTLANNLTGVKIAQSTVGRNALILLHCSRRIGQGHCTCLCANRSAYRHRRRGATFDSLRLCPTLAAPKLGSSP